MAERRAGAQASVTFGCARSRPAALWVRNRKREPERCRNSNWGSRHHQIRVPVVSSATTEWDGLFGCPAAPASPARHAFHLAVAAAQVAALAVGVERPVSGSLQAGVSCRRVQEASAALAEDGGIAGHHQTGALRCVVATLRQQVVGSVDRCPNV